MSIRTRPVAVPNPSVRLPDAHPSVTAEVVRLRRMVHALAEMLVECGVVDASMVEGRLRLAAVEADPPAKVSWWSRLWKRRSAGAIPSVMMPVDQTVPVQKLPFEVQSLYDEAAPWVVAPARLPVGSCARCWKRAPLDAGQVCARCAVRPG